MKHNRGHHRTKGCPHTTLSSVVRKTLQHFSSTSWVMSSPRTRFFGRTFHHINTFQLPSSAELESDPSGTSIASIPTQAPSEMLSAALRRHRRGKCGSNPRLACVGPVSPPLPQCVVCVETAPDNRRNDTAKLQLVPMCRRTQ